MTGSNGIATTLPLHRVRLDSGLVSGDVMVRLAITLPVTGVQLLLGNDLAGDKVVTDTDPVMTNSPIDSNHNTALQGEFSSIFLACVITLSMTKVNKLDAHEINM